MSPSNERGREGGKEGGASFNEENELKSHGQADLSAKFTAQTES